MARLPDASALGALPDARSNRPIASYDVSGAGRAAAAYERGAQDLARGVDKLGAAAGEALKQEVREEDRLEEARANSQRLIATKQLDDELAAETEPADLQAKYGPRYRKVLDDSAGLIRNPRRRELFLNTYGPDVEGRALKASDLNTKLVNDRDLAGAETRLGTLQQNAAAERDEFMSGEYVRAAHLEIDALADRGIITREKARERKQKWAKEYVFADGLARIDRGEGETLLHDLRTARDAIRPVDVSAAADPKAAAALNAGAEELGIPASVLASAISYETGGTFNPDKWGGKGGNHLGLIQFGPEERKTYGVKPGMTFEQQMGPVVAYLRDRGVKPGMGLAEVYSIINAGSLDRNGQPRWNAHDGNGSVRDHVAKIERDHGGKASAFLGAPTTDGRGAGDRVPNKYEMLSPLDRETLITRAETAMRKQGVTDAAAFKARVEDTRTEAFNTGAAANPLTQEDFTSRFGADAGGEAFAQYSADLQLGADLQKLSSMSPQEQEQMLASYAPAPGDANYTAKLKRQGEVGKAINTLQKELYNKQTGDPAGYAIRRLPAAREGYEQLQAVLGNPVASSDEKRAAARNYALVMDAEQARIGVPQDQRRIVPRGYVDGLVKRLENPTGPDGKGTNLDAARQLQAEAALWGEDWPKVARDVQGKATKPIVRVLAAGVDDQAAMALPSLVNVSTKDILKGQPETKEKEVQTEAGKTLTKFASSLLGTRQENEIVRDYAAAAEKLTAHYTQGGKSSADAAALAFQGLLGHKYDFVEGGMFGPWGSARGTVRVPKDTGVPLEKITAGANLARDRLAELGLAPAVSGDAALDNDYLQRAAVSGLRRDGVWATAPGDAGLILVHNGKVATKTDGVPMLLTWKQLGDLADERTASLRTLRSEGFDALSRMQ